MGHQEISRGLTAQQSLRAIARTLHRSPSMISHAYDSMADVRPPLTRYFTFYNSRRPHSALDGKTPDQADSKAQRQAA